MTNTSTDLARLRAQASPAVLARALLLLERDGDRDLRRLEVLDDGRTVLVRNRPLEVTTR